jgi:hypothetical protein
MSDRFSGGHTGQPAERPFAGRFSIVVINWVANPFRGDKFEEAWRPAAAAATRYGASGWAFTRSRDDPLSFMQFGVFESKLDFERYWYSEEISEARVAIGGLYQVPILPIWYEAVGWGIVSDDIGEAEEEADKDLADEDIEAA